MKLYEVWERLPDGRERCLTPQPLPLASAREAYRTRVIWAGEIREVHNTEQQE